MLGTVPVAVAEGLLKLQESKFWNLLVPEKKTLINCPRQTSRECELNQEPLQSSQAVYLTLLSVADNHELLASIAGSVHRHQQLSNILLNLELCLRDEDSRFCFGRETRLMK